MGYEGELHVRQAPSVCSHPVLKHATRPRERPLVIPFFVVDAQVTRADVGARGARRWVSAGISPTLCGREAARADGPTRDACTIGNGRVCAFVGIKHAARAASGEKRANQRFARSIDISPASSLARFAQRPCPSPSRQRRALPCRDPRLRAARRTTRASPSIPPASRARPQPRRKRRGGLARKTAHDAARPSVALVGAPFSSCPWANPESSARRTLAC